MPWFLLSSSLQPLAVFSTGPKPDGQGSWWKQAPCDTEQRIEDKYTSDRHRASRRPLKQWAFLEAGPRQEASQYAFLNSASLIQFSQEPFSLTPWKGLSLFLFFQFGWPLGSVRIQQIGCQLFQFVHFCHSLLGYLFQLSINFGVSQ